MYFYPVMKPVSPQQLSFGKQSEPRTFNRTELLLTQLRQAKISLKRHEDPEQETIRQTLIQKTMQGVDELAKRTNKHMGKQPLTVLPWNRATLKELGFTDTEIDALGQEFELSTGQSHE